MLRKIICLCVLPCAGMVHASAISALIFAAETPVRDLVEYPDWKYSGSMWLLTTPDGADLPTSASVEGFPLLVRLHKDFFDFGQAKAHGEDLRFSLTTGERLPYQIEDWDAANGTASVWVRMPKVSGNSRQEIRLNWGNASAKSESDGNAVFNESNGYLSVWHMNSPVQDEVGTLSSTDTGTMMTTGVIGAARKFPGGNGIFCGDMIPDYPSGARSHSTEAWIRAVQPNGRVLAWGNEEAQGKVVMNFASPPHITMDCYFSDANVSGESAVSLSEWLHVVHTYQEGTSRLYINGRLDGETLREGNPLKLRSPAKLWLGGWYNNYDFVGDLDEIRVSQVARSADWIRLQYANQKTHQSVVGPLIQPGNEFSVSVPQVAVAEGQEITVTGTAGGAQKTVWILKQDGRESVVATDRFSYTFDAGRVVSNQSRTLTFKAVYPNGVKTRDIAIAIINDIPEPVFTLSAPATWDGRQIIQVVPRISNTAAMEACGEGQLNFSWSADGIAVTKQIEPGKLILKRAQGSGPLRISVAIDNGGAKIIESVTIAVQEPVAGDLWVPRPAADSEQPEDNQFFARDGHASDDQREGTLVYAGTLEENADAVFVRVFADDQLFATETDKLTAAKKYSLSVRLKAGLIKYRAEFGVKAGGRETVLHTASNLVCGDAFLINGQSNAVANDFGAENPLVPSDWVRTFGATDGGPQGARLKLWAPAQARSPGGKSEIGYWGMELGRRLVESERIPICIINGAVGGTRIDQHQRNESDPTDVSTIYGRLLWRVQQAGLTHGIRAVLWHQGENDQGADGPTGRYGYETYRQFFMDLAATWKEDYPNIQHYYAFQIWPKSCAMGIHGSDNRLREVQRTLPSLFSNMSVMSTLGIKPPGGCHFPAEGYAEFARLISPLIERDHYRKTFDKPITPPNLLAVSCTSGRRDELVLEFDQNVVWTDALTSQFYLDGEAGLVASGAANGKRITLKLTRPSSAGTVTYLDSASWNPDNLLYGQNGLAALTFCDAKIAEPGTSVIR